MIEREAQLDAQGPEPKCHGIGYDARDITCSACKLSTSCMYAVYKGPIQARIAELGEQKPYFDLTDFEAIPDVELIEMIQSGEFTEDMLAAKIAKSCSSTVILARHRLAIIKAKYSL